jgi:formate-dependent nitrite reductase membrane component NrfD
VPSQPHGAAFGAVGDVSPDAVAASLGRNDGGFGRAQETYFDHPVLQKPHWSWEIVGYFFAGGMAAASAALATIADAAGDPCDRALVRNGRYAALAGAAVSGVLLIADLGRPERFLAMMRIFKLKSPMSVGVYAFSAFSATAGLAALEQARADGTIARNPLGWIPKGPRVAVHALAAALMATYTGVLVSATAIPVWYRGRRHLPAIFACSAASTGCALQNGLLALGAGSPATSRKLEVIETIAGAAEALLLLDYERTAGVPGKALFGGARGRRLKRMTLGLGLAVPALMALPGLFGRHPKRGRRLRGLITAACALTGGYVLRESVVYAGPDSADDPRAYLQHPV